MVIIIIFLPRLYLNGNLSLQYIPKYKIILWYIFTLIIKCYIVTIMNKAFVFYKNPIIVFGFGVLIFALILFLVFGFKMPDYFTNIDMANQIIENIHIDDKEKALTPLINPLYYIYNYMRHIFAGLIALYIFSVTFRLNTFSAFKNIKIFSNKIFLYIWVNFSYLIAGICSYYIAVADMESPVYRQYPDHAETFAYVFICIFPFLVAIFYYPIMNFLLSLTYNMRLKSKFTLYAWFLCLMILIFAILLGINSYFTYLYIIAYLYYIFWFVIIFHSINSLKELINIK